MKLVQSECIEAISGIQRNVRVAPFNFGSWVLGRNFTCKTSCLSGIAYVKTVSHIGKHARLSVPVPITSFVMW